jgi:hypothetical protein
MMHTRPIKAPIGDPEARDALDDMRGLLRRLSTRLTEKGHRIRWKKLSWRLEEAPIVVRFTDAAGVEWTVWDVRSSNEKHHRRPHGDPTAP